MRGSRFPYLLPVAIFLVIAIALGVGLTLRPDVIPSALIDEPVPEFDLPSVYEDGRGFSSADLHGGETVLVNIFASWCVPCRAEHPILMRLSDRGVTIYGLAYKDTPADSRRFLDELGNPYTGIGADVRGRVGIDWGVYGVPETFVVNGEGRIIAKWVGPLTEDSLQANILPVLRDNGVLAPAEGPE